MTQLTFRQPAKRLIGSTLWLVLSVLLAASLLPLLYPLWPLFSVFEHFTWQLFWSSLTCALLALSLRRWRAAILAIALAIWCGIVIGPIAASPYVDRQAQITDGHQLRLVSLNLFNRSTTSDATIAFLKKADADVIGLVEVTPFWMTALQPLLNDYPFRVGCPRPAKTCDVLLLSKRPLLQSDWHAATPGLPSLAWVKIDAGGRPLFLVETHLYWPLSRAGTPSLITSDDTPLSSPSLHGVPTLTQGRQAAGLVEYLKPLGPDLVMMGDFNSAPWSRLQRGLRAATGLRNAPGLALTWPRWTISLLRLPIDQVFLRGAVSALPLTAGPEVDSDHLPISTTLTVAP